LIHTLTYAPHMQETSTRVLELFEDDAEMVARMLLCLYTSDYPIQVHEKSEPSNQSVSQLVEQGRTHTLARDYIFETNPYLIISKMFVLADKYDMSGLKDLCVEKLQTNKPSDKFSNSKLKRFLGSLDHIYSSTPPICSSLRRAAAKIVQQRYCEILADPATKGMLQAACLAHSQLGWDLVSTLFVAKDLLCTSCQILLKVPEDIVDAFDVWEWCKDGDKPCLCGLTQICGRGACLAQIKKQVRCPDCLSVENIHQGDFSTMHDPTGY
jgi:hypothetical protein